MTYVMPGGLFSVISMKVIHQQENEMRRLTSFAIVGLAAVFSAGCRGGDEGAPAATPPTIAPSAAATAPISALPATVAPAETPAAAPDGPAPPATPLTGESAI